MSTNTAATKADLQTLASDVNARFDRLEKRASDSFDDLTTLLQTFMMQIDERFKRVEEEHREIKASINRLYDYVDKVAKQQEIDDQERLVMGHQLDRLDRWVHQLADKIGYSLEI